MVVEWLDACLDFEDRIPNSGQAVAPVRRCEQLRFDHADPVGQGEELHWLAGNLVVGAPLDDEATGHHSLADVLAQAIHRAVGVLGHVREQFERMAAHGETEQVGFRLQPFEACRFVEQDSKRSLQSGRLGSQQLRGRFCP